MYRPIEWSAHAEVLQAAELLWIFCKQVNGDDLSEIREYTMPDGSKVQMIEAEAQLYAYKNRSCGVQLALVSGIAAGLLIYNEVFESIVAIRCLYCEPWSQGLKLGKGLVNSLQPIPQSIIFQSRKAAPPERMLNLTGARKSVIGQTQDFITYAMDWRCDDGIQTQGAENRDKDS